jgi:hypothetical protein
MGRFGLSWNATEGVPYRSKSATNSYAEPNPRALSTVHSPLSTFDSHGIDASIVPCEKLLKSSKLFVSYDVPVG